MKTAIYEHLYYTKEAETTTKIDTKRKSTECQIESTAVQLIV